MYTTFFKSFGLRENPFNVNPDPNYLFLNQQTQALLDEIANAIQARKGLIVLTGEAGTGKTTVVNRLKLGLQEEKAATVFIFNPHLDVDELFHLMIAGFGITVDRSAKGSSLARINHWLHQQYSKGRNAVLFLDEAQGLPAPVLEQIRMLLNNEMPQEKLLQVVLSGQPELEQKLKRADMRQIRQRISLRCYTRPLTLEETHAYMEKRLRVAGGNGRNVFSSEAIDAAFLYSHGIPRVLNLLCEHAMMRASSRHEHLVSAYMIEEAANQLQFDDVKPVRNWNPDTVPEEEPLVGLAPSLSETQPETGLQPLIQEITAVAAPRESAHATSTWFETSINAAADAQPELRPVSLDESGSSGKKKLEPTPVSEFRTQHGSPVELKPMSIEDDASQLPAASLPDHSKGRVTVIPVQPKNDRGSGAAKALQELLQKWGKWAGEVPNRAKGISSVAIACKRGISNAARKASILAKSQGWDKNLESVIRWLQEPLPTAKIHRRAGH